MLQSFSRIALAILSVSSFGHAPQNRSGESWPRKLDAEILSLLNCATIKAVAELRQLPFDFHVFK